MAGEELLDNDKMPCIRCGKDTLDTGWECTECGMDCRDFYYPQHKVMAGLRGLQERLDQLPKSPPHGYDDSMKRGD